MYKYQSSLTAVDRLQQKADIKQSLWQSGKGTGDIRSQFRKAGIILHISSLPSPYGIGTLGQAAFEFIDFLSAADQSYWQVLPLSSIDSANSPYKSDSTRAGNELLIDIDELVADGLLPDFKCDHTFNSECVDYELVRQTRTQWLAEAYANYQRGLGQHLAEDFQIFQAKNTWIIDYSLFRTIKEEYPQPWQDWPHELKYRDIESIRYLSEQKHERLQYYAFCQFLFFRQWQKVLNYAHTRGISIIGDVPIYVSEDCVDVWCEPEQFLLNENLEPTAVAGCPPDYFSEDGQLWGNPLYNWQFMQQQNFSWWIKRIAFNCQLFDILRIDHFRGLEAYWSVPAGSITARDGSWYPGPGIKLFQEIRNQLGVIDIIAEDLGLITPEVNNLRRNCGFPGMKVLLFAFAPGANSDYLPHNLEEDCVLYVGTHDNNTVRGWCEEGEPAEIDFACEYLNFYSSEDLPNHLIRVAMTSVSDTVMVQMQDYLGLGADARMNTPGTAVGNWQWRMRREAMTNELARRISRLVEISGRKPTEWH